MAEVVSFQSGSRMWQSHHRCQEYHEGFTDLRQAERSLRTNQQRVGRVGAVAVRPENVVIPSPNDRQTEMAEVRSSDWHRVCLLALWVAVVISSVSAASATVRNRKVARLDGDLILGALFSVHKAPSDSQVTDRTCGDIQEQYGVQRVEVMMKTLQDINEDSSILPNVTIGYEIRDSCWYSSVALEQSLQFVSDNIGAVGKRTTGDLDASLPVDNQCLPDGNTGSKLPAQKPIVGVIGPGSSAVSIQVQNLLQLFNIPQVGFSATSKDLSDKTLYEYFIRVCPSDTLQAQAMVDIVLRYNWSYVSTVHTTGNYGASGMEVFKDLATRAGICIATNDNVNSQASKRKFEKVVTKLLLTPTARVVVCFCEGRTVTNLMKATQRLGVSGRFLFIGSDGWADRYEVVEGVEEHAVGGITIKPQTSRIQDFDPYYWNLRPENHTENPWFQEFWEFRFKCELPLGKNETLEKGRKRFSRKCTGKETLATNYSQDAKMGFVINAIYTMAHGLDNMHRILCPPDTVGLCPAMNPVDGQILLKYLFNVSFIGVSGDRIEFDKNGDPTGRYDIFNYQRLPNGLYRYVSIGEWAAGILTLNDSAIMWNNASDTPVTSFCSPPCEKGHIKDIRDNVHCCWACVPCAENQIMLNEFKCETCEDGQWPNQNLSYCVGIEVEFMHWDDIEAVVAVSFSCLGICLTLFVLITFIRYNDTPVVKSSSRENSYILLVGILMCFSMTFIFIAVPTVVMCYVRRIGLGLSFCLCYAALVVRTNRMARILAGSKKKIITRKPRFLSSTAQVVMTFMVIGIQVVIIVVLLLIEPPDAILDYPELRRVRLICNTTTLGILGPLGFDSFLVIMCTLYAFKTRNLPENFNEAKYIAFTMYTTCVVWLAFIPLYFGGNEMRSTVVCFAVSLSATVALACLFFPKTYIVLFKPERNRRSSMKTSSLVRMHVGTFSELAPLSSQKSSSVNGSLEMGLARDRRVPNPGFNRKRPAKDKSFFGGLRRRRRGYNQVNMMKAVERDRIQRRRQPIYRYTPADETQTRRMSASQEGIEDKGSDHEKVEAKSTQNSPEIAVVKPRVDHTVTTLQEVYRESALRDPSSGSLPSPLLTSAEVSRRYSGGSVTNSGDSVVISMVQDTELEDSQGDGQPLLTNAGGDLQKQSSGPGFSPDIPQIVTSYHGSSQDLTEPQVGQMRNSLESTPPTRKRRVSDVQGLPRPGSNPFQFLPRRRSHGSLEGKPAIVLCSAPPCKHSLKYRKQLARSAEVLNNQGVPSPLPTSSTVNSFSVSLSPQSLSPVQHCKLTSSDSVLLNQLPGSITHNPDETQSRNTTASATPTAQSKIRLQTPTTPHVTANGLIADSGEEIACQPSAVWNEASLEELATGQNTPLRALPEIRSSNV